MHIRKVILILDEQPNQRLYMTARELAFVEWEVANGSLHVSFKRGFLLLQISGKCDIVRQGSKINPTNCVYCLFGFLLSYIHPQKGYSNMVGILSHLLGRAHQNSLLNPAASDLTKTSHGVAFPLAFANCCGIELSSKILNLIYLVKK